MPPIDISILIVSYNTHALTRAALDSVLSQTRTTCYEVIVVDNASTDGSAKMIGAHPVQPKLIALDDNIGFARANNLAAQHARGRYILLLNPDTLVIDGAIDRLFAFAQHYPKARIWGGRTLFANGLLNPSSCWARMTPWNLFCRASGLAAIFPAIETFNGEAIGGWRRDSIRNVDIVSGCFFLIETALWRGLKGFDPLFFRYGEEADLCLRARGFSAKPMITPDATIVHYGGASERVRTDKMVRLLSAKSSLIARHWHRSLGGVGRLLLSAWPLTRAVAMSIAATLLPRRSWCDSAASWRAVWARRSEWLHGYRDASSGQAEPGLIATARGQLA